MIRSTVLKSIESSGQERRKSQEDCCLDSRMMHINQHCILSYILQRSVCSLSIEEGVPLKMLV
jgi:hypothetical protein